jgi:hypothetical protein
MLAPAWLGWHDPEPRSEPEPGSVLAVGIDVGVAARQIVPGGVLVEEGPQQHAEAVERTRELITDPTVPAIFEAAFTFNNVVIRADILERLPGGKWRLAEVKSTMRVKPEHKHDLAVQAYVIAGSGLSVQEMHLVHVDTSYVRGKDGIDWQRYFKRRDVTAEVRDLLPFVPQGVAEMHTILALPEAPDIRPSRHCFSPHECEFWPRCTARKPADWIIHIPRLSKVAFTELDAAGVESMRDIPADFPLSPAQQRVVHAMRSGRGFVTKGLHEALARLGPPASYLDFETFAPVLPVYAGTSPYQRIPFQWSLHYDDGISVEHYEYLAVGDVDPRREFADTLLEIIEDTVGPIIVYSGFEASVLRDLADVFPDVSGHLHRVIDRFCDLLPIIRKHVSHPEFCGSYSIKSVAPALVPGFAYMDLVDVRNGDDRPLAGPDRCGPVGRPASRLCRRARGSTARRRMPGMLQADAYAGFSDLCGGKCKPGPITDAPCWSHGRRHFFERRSAQSAAGERVWRIDAVFAIEREINGLGGRARSGSPGGASLCSSVSWKNGCQ